MNLPLASGNATSLKTCISELHKFSKLTSSLCHQSKCELVTQLSFISKSIICNLIEFPMIQNPTIKIQFLPYLRSSKSPSLNHTNWRLLKAFQWYQECNKTNKTHGGLEDLIVTNITNKTPSFIIDFCLVLNINEMSVKNISYLLAFIVKGTIIPLFWVSSTHRVLTRTPHHGVRFNG